MATSDPWPKPTAMFSVDQTTHAAEGNGHGSSNVTGLPRRDFLTGLAAAAVGALIPVGGSWAQSSGKNEIDWHHHFGPPQWRSFLGSRDLLPHFWSGWTPARDMEEMDQAGVAKSLVSITYPGIWLSGSDVSADATRRMARECNEYGATMVTNHPDRYGLFAVLPLPDVDGSLREIDYALGTLKADGVGVLTSYGDKWLGDPSFAPVLEELNRRGAIVFTHPNVADCCTRGGTGTHRYLVPGVDNNILEFAFDTTRAIMSLVVINATVRYPNIRFSFSHAGGTMPFLVERILGREDLVKRLDSTAEPNSRLYQLRQFYYDTANANNPVALDALKKVVGASQILLGTDYPYEGHMFVHVNDLKEGGVFTAKELQAVLRGNAIKLIPHA